LANEATARGSRTWRVGRATAGALGLAFAVFYLLEGRDLPLGRMGAPGPGVFPLGVGVIFALVSVGVIADALLTRRPGTASFPEGRDLTRLVLVAGGFVAYVLLLNVFGFVIATFVLVAAFTRLVGNVSVLTAGASGVGVTLAVWAVFTLFLGVRLPSPMWG
jgi:putative tricarboxylic transport membrane protein